MAGTAGTAPLGGLAGRTVVLTRSPDRGGAMLDILSRTGARVVLCPVIDFELVADTSMLDKALRRLTAGGFDWLVVTSTTTVRALAQRCAALDLKMAELPGEHTQVAAVGDATRKALEAQGIAVDLVPAGEHSGAGLLQAWPATQEPATVLLPQADIADPALGQGLLARGADVVSPTAYHTVNYPADPHRRLDQPPSTATAAPVWTPPDFAAAQRRGEVDAVVLTSPSAARRISEECDPLQARIKVVAIGRPTAREAERCGLPVAAIAPEPSGEGIAIALAQVFGANEGGNTES